MPSQCVSMYCVISSNKYSVTLEILGGMLLEFVSSRQMSADAAFSNTSLADAGGATALYGALSSTDSESRHMLGCCTISVLGIAIFSGEDAIDSAGG